MARIEEKLADIEKEHAELIQEAHKELVARCDRLGQVVVAAELKLTKQKLNDILAGRRKLTRQIIARMKDAPAERRGE